MAVTLKQKAKLAGKPLPVAPAIPCDFEFPWLFVGAKLEHKAFGLCTVTRLDIGTNSMRTMSIQSEAHGERTMLVVFANVHLRVARA